MSKGKWKRKTKMALTQQLREARARIAELEDAMHGIALIAQGVTKMVYASAPKITARQIDQRVLDALASPPPVAEQSPPADLSDDDNLGEGRWV